MLKVSNLPNLPVVHLDSIERNRRTFVYLQTHRPINDHKEFDGFEWIEKFRNDKAVCHQKSIMRNAKATHFQIVLHIGVLLLLALWPVRLLAIFPYVHNTRSVKQMVRVLMNLPRFVTCSNHIRKTC